MTLVLAAACGGAQLPGTSYVAPGSTPEPLRIELSASGDQTAVRNRATQVLADSEFHLTGVEPSAVTGYSLGRLLKVRIDVLRGAPAPDDRPSSSHVVVTGEMYVGDLARRDSIAALPERWRLLTASDGGAIELRDLGRAIQLVSDRAGDRPIEAPAMDSATAQRFAATPVGRTVDVCTPSAIPAGWLVLAWVTDRSRCPAAAGKAFAGEPNVMRVEREW